MIGKMNFSRRRLVEFDSRLKQCPDAYEKFGTLSSEQKEKLTDYILTKSTANTFSERCDEIVSSLGNTEKMWFDD